ncbi:hypothetical protein BDW74DRAFT_170165 [Aspergillus multicolor]|uniref:uncharacterized protein n=1 Tax=Aspergillus multicolor TaxID=41759 RepID=UPI003CCCF7A7
MTFNPKTDIPPLTGKVILVTGGNFYRHCPATVWFAARDPAKGHAAADEIKRLIPCASIRTLALDLSSFDSVREAAKVVIQESSRRDIIMLNAEIMATPPGLRANDYEIQFGTNYLGHALLTALLTPLLEKNRSYSRCRPGILWTRALAKRCPQFTVAAVHPGVVQMNLLSGARDAPCLFRLIFGAAQILGLKSSVETGVKNQLWAAVSKDVVSGEYYEPVGVGGRPSAYAVDDEVVEEIWGWTMGEFKGHFV